jgi:GTP-binding protein HflX
MRPPQPRERAALVGLKLRRSKRHDAEQSLDELAGLAEAAGADVVLKMLQERPTPDPATFIGSGKLADLAAECARFAADLVIFDHELTPAQLRHIEDRVDRKVIDRTQLILDIFARRARTREGKWQVELAQLKYLLPRLAGSGTALSRLGGGIGTRGPGETKLETDRRRIRQKIHVISQEIDSIWCCTSSMRQTLSAIATWKPSVGCSRKWAPPTWRPWTSLINVTSSNPAKPSACGGQNPALYVSLPSKVGGAKT